MSNYIQVLKRLESEKRRARTSDVPAPTEAPAAAAAPAVSVSAASRTTPPAEAPSAKNRPAPTAGAPIVDAPTKPVVAAAVEPSVAPTVEPPVAPPPSVLPPVVRRPAAEATATERRPAGDHPATRVQAALSPSPQGVATLFASIQALTSGRAAKAVVFAGASSSRPVETLTESLAAYAETRGMHVLLADLVSSEGRTSLVERSGGTSAGRNLAPLALDLSAGDVASLLDAWIERATPAVYLVVLTGPPLADTIDGALLARACDGLVIVAETDVTDRNALKIAAERANLAGCTSLGVVMSGARSPMPSWVQRLLPTKSTPTT